MNMNNVLNTRFNQVITIARTKRSAKEAQSDQSAGRVGMLARVNARLFVLMGLTWLVSLVPNTAEFIASVASGQQGPAVGVLQALCYLNVLSQLVFTVLNGSLGTILLMAFLLRPRALAALAARLRIRRFLCCCRTTDSKESEAARSNSCAHAGHKNNGRRGRGKGPRSLVSPQAGPRPSPSNATIATTLDDKECERGPSSTGPNVENQEVQNNRSSASEESCQTRQKQVFVVKF